MRVMINHGSMGSLHIISARENQVKDWVMFFFVAEAFVLQSDWVFIAGHGPSNSYCTGANWTVYFTAKHGQKGSNRVPVPRFDLYKY